jgi:pyrroline-5-carboxylate reductase
MNERVGIIGFGNMGSAIAEHIKNHFIVFVFDKDTSKTRGLLLGINVANDIKYLLDKTDIIILAVKPQDLDEVLAAIKDNIKGKLIISIVAGKSTRYIEDKLGKVKVIRVMPNLPAKIGEGISCISKGRYVTKLSDLVLAEYIFRLLGKTEKVREDMMNDVTAVSGSGPGYYYKYCPTRAYEYPASLIKFENEYYIPNLSLSAQELGFSKRQAERLSMATAEGSRKLLLHSKTIPAKLRKQVTSKGGTTQAALKVFQKCGQPRPGKKIWIQAVKVAKKRAEELSKS